MKEEEEGMTVERAAAWLGITPKCLRRRKDRGLVPYRTVGRSIIFWKSDLEQWRQGLDGVSVEEALENMRRRNGND